MIRRGVLLAALLLLLPLGVAAQTPQQQNARPRRRRRARPQAAAPAPAPAQPRGEPAPVPNRDLEAPRRAESATPPPRIDPALIDPNEPRMGATADPHGPQAREDRLLRQPAPGARLRMPFSY